MFVSYSLSWSGPIKLEPDSEQDLTEKLAMFANFTISKFDLWQTEWQKTFCFYFIVNSIIIFYHFMLKKSRSKLKLQRGFEYLSFSKIKA